MPRDLPDDLARLGDDLTAAAARRIAARRHRIDVAARLAATAAAGALALAVLAPGTLAPSDNGGPALLAAEPAAAAPGCDDLRGGRMKACLAAGEEAMVLYRPYAVQ